MGEYERKFHPNRPHIVQGWRPELVTDTKREDLLKAEEAKQRLGKEKEREYWELRGIKKDFSEEESQLSVLRKWISKKCGISSPQGIVRTNKSIQGHGPDLEQVAHQLKKYLSLLHVTLVHLQGDMNDFKPISTWHDPYKLRIAIRDMPWHLKRNWKQMFSKKDEMIELSKKYTKYWNYVWKKKRLPRGSMGKVFNGQPIVNVMDRMISEESDVRKLFWESIKLWHQILDYYYLRYVGNRK